MPSLIIQIWQKWWCQRLMLLEQALRVTFPNIRSFQIKHEIFLCVLLVVTAWRFLLHFSLYDSVLLVTLQSWFWLLQVDCDSVWSSAGTDFSNAVLDRVNFGKANLQGAIFKNTVLSGSTFDEAELQDAVFEDTIIGYIDLQKLCTNKTISDEGRAELGCRWPHFIPDSALVLNDRVNHVS